MFSFTTFLYLGMKEENKIQKSVLGLVLIFFSCRLHLNYLLPRSGKTATTYNEDTNYSFISILTECILD